MKRPIRLAAAVLAPVLTAGVLAAAPSAQAAPVTPLPSPAAQAASQWLAGQLTNGLIHNNGYGGFDDYGLTVDTGLALIATGTQPAALTTITNALAANISNYVGDGTTSVYSGSTGKAAVFAKDAGRDPASFGGRNLIAQLEGTVSTTAPIAGRIEDTSTYGDYANVLGQAWAVEALDRSGSAKSASATDFFLKQQCSEGYFRTYLTPEKSAVDQSCDGGKAASESDPSTDVTALAVITLSQHSKTPAVSAAIAKAKGWLTAAQAADGSWGGGAGTSTANSNSTGLATRALSGSASAKRGVAWLTAHQATANDGALAGEAGAIAYDDAVLATARTAGIVGDTARDQWRRATAQAALGVSAQTPPLVSVRSAVVKRKKPIVIRSNSFQARERVVVRYKGKVVKRGKATKSGVFKARFRSGKKAGSFQVAVIGKQTGTTVFTVQVKR